VNDILLSLMKKVNLTPSMPSFLTISPPNLLNSVQSNWFEEFQVKNIVE